MMMDPFLTGLVAGAALGLAGLTGRIAQVAVVGALAFMASVVAVEGIGGLDHVLSDAVEVLTPHAHILAGIAVGAILAGSLPKGWMTRGS